MENNASASNSSMLSETRNLDVGAWEIFQITVYALLGLLTVVLNLFMLLVLKRGRDIFDDVTVTLFRSLATIDIITGLIFALLEGTIYCLIKLPASSTLCAYVPFVSMFMMYCSMVHVLFLNLQRFVAVTYPFWYLRLVTARRVNICITIVEVILLGVASMLLPISSFPLEPVIRLYCSPQGAYTGHFDNVSATTAMNATIGVIFAIFLVPLFILTVVNIRLGIVSFRRRKRPPVEENDQPQDEDTNKKCHSKKGCSLPKGLKTVAIITILFYLSCVPYTFVFAVTLAQPSLDEKWYQAFVFLNYVIAISSCWWNVPVYMLTSVSVRQRSLKVFGRIKCISSHKETSLSSAQDIF